MSNKIVNRSEIGNFLIISTLAFFSIGCQGDTYGTFKPIININGEFKFDEAKQSSEFFLNIQLVLDFYGVPYKKTENGEILIPERILNDKEIIWNYTNKARDPNWIREQKQWLKTK